MPQIELDEHIFRCAQASATEAGFDTVEAYIADLVVADRAGSTTDDFSHLFTAELLARFDQISREIKADGKAFTVAEMREIVAGRRSL
jgi:hypothetical protein